jgi:uncharacterized protein YhfF
MHVPDVIARFWRRFEAAAGGVDPARFYEAFHFADNEGLADSLAELVLVGTKRATAGSLWSFEREGKPLPQPGDLSVVTSWAGAPLCVIETVQVEVVPFNEVTAEFAAVEGEGDGSLEFWRQEHARSLSRECARIGRVFNESMPVACERFRVVFTGSQSAV